MSPPPYAVIAADDGTAPKPPPYSAVIMLAPVEPPAYSNIAYANDAPPPFEPSAPPPTDLTVDNLPQPVSVATFEQPALHTNGVQRVMTEPPNT
jgi:hypothetical protein